MEVHLSETEQLFIIHGVQQGMRNDGRSCEEFRPLIIETDVVSHASGSSKVRLGNTEVIAAVKAEIGTPLAGRPKQGQALFFVDCSANATPYFEGRGGDELAEGISMTLSQAYNNDIALNLTRLGLVDGIYCWDLHVDIVVLECGGSLLDTVSIAVKAALYNARLPEVNIRYNEEKEEYDVEPTDDHYSFWDIREDVIKGAPLLVTVAKLGSSQVVDATGEEECCSGSQLLVAVTNDDTVTLIRQMGHASLEHESIDEMVSLAVKVGSQLHKSIIDVLEDIPSYKETNLQKMDQEKN